MFDPLVKFSGGFGVVRRHNTSEVADDPAKAHHFLLGLLPEFDEGFFDHPVVQEAVLDFLEFVMNVDEETVYLGSFSDEMVLDGLGREEAIGKDFDGDGRLVVPM